MFNFGNILQVPTSAAPPRRPQIEERNKIVELSPIGNGFELSS